MPSRSTRIRHESWPPTQMRLQDSPEHDGDKMDQDVDPSAMDDDPLTYFLTPASALDDNDADGEDVGAMMDLDFDFDAGIEDVKHPPQIVRSVSPSSLSGGLALPPQPPTPPRSPPARLSPDPESTTDDDDEEEEYIGFATGRLHALGLPFTLKDFAALKARKAAKSRAAASASLAPPAVHGGVHAPTAISARGRPAARFGSSPPGLRNNRPGNFPGRRRSPHAWREPSPDVWSIEEETEEDVCGSAVGEAAAAGKQAAPAPAPEVVKVKPKKKVRFVLPAKEDY